MANNKKPLFGLLFVWCNNGVSGTGERDKCDALWNMTKLNENDDDDTPSDVSSLH